MPVTFLPVGNSSIDLHEAQDERLALYSTAGVLVGRIAPAAWEIGDLDTPGLRASIDPAGGLRFRNAGSQLMNLLDQQGMSVRDPVTGSVISELSREKLRLTDVAGGNEIVLSTQQAVTLATPRYTGATQIAPTTTVSFPSAALLSTADLELSHAAAFRRGTVQACTWTPPAGWTEVIDNDYGLASTLATSVASRGAATGTAGTFAPSATTHDVGAGTHVIVRGTPGTIPTVRSTTQLENTTTGTLATLAITKPAGVVAGDVLVVMIAMGNAGGSVPIGWATPDGWVFLGAQVTLTGSGSTMSTLAVGTWAKLCGSSEPATYDTAINFGAGVKTIHVSMVAVQNSTSTPAGQQFNIGGYNLAGAWRDYTPTNANLTVGSGVMSASYLLMGKTCFVSWYFLYGAGSSITGSLAAGLPFPSSVGARQAFSVHILDSGSRNFVGVGRVNPGASVANIMHSEAGNLGFVDPTNPMTFVSGDSVALTGLYEIA